MRHSFKTLLSLVPILAISALCFVSACGEDPVEPGNVERGHKLATSTKCNFCHQVEGRGGMIAPPMDKALSLANALVRDYEKRVMDLKAAFPKAYSAAQPTIDAILAEKDHARRFELWLNGYLIDTKFDNPMTKMGNVIMTEQQRADVIAWLATQRQAQ